MTLHEILTEIPRLTPREQLVLLEVLSRSLREGLTPTGLHQRAERESTVDTLFGAFNPTRQALSDADLDRIRYESIVEKHS